MAGRHHAGHSDDEIRVEHKKKENNSVSMKRLRVNVSDRAARHKAPLISAVCRSCRAADAVMGRECSSSLPRQNVNRQDGLPHLKGPACVSVRQSDERLAAKLFQVCACLTAAQTDTPVPLELGEDLNLRAEHLIIIEEDFLPIKHLTFSHEP